MTGTTLSHYRVIEKLGEGTSAVVYLAEDLVLGRPVVLKLLPPSRAGDEAASQRFLNEARTASSLNHPSICTIHEIAEHEGRPFIVMERLDGRTLAEVIAGAPLDTTQILELTGQLADALDAAHANGIVHRDIKPPNIVVTKRGQAVLLDFGVAMLVHPLQRRATPETGTSGNRFGRWGGTLAYMSPEQLRGEEIDGRSDIFSLGAVLFEMVIGQPAFGGADPTAIATAILTQSPPPLRTLWPDAPPELERIVGKALDPNRELRYQTAADLRADLQRLRRDIELAGGVAPLPPAAAPTPLWQRPPVAAAAVVAAALVVGLALADAQDIRARMAGAPAPAAAPMATAPAATHELPAQPDTRPVDVRASATLSRAAPVKRAAPSASRRRKPSIAGATAASRKTVEARHDATPSAAPAPTETPIVEAPPSMEQELSVARAQLAHKLDEQAIATLRDAVQRQGNNPVAIEGYFLMASIQERQKPEDAMATYVQIADRFADHARASEALFRLAETTLSSRRPGKESDARQVLDSLIERHPRSAWAVKALVAKAHLEERQNIVEVDPVLGVSVPAAIASYRRVVARDDAQGVREEALWKLGTLYEEVKRYDLAVEAYTRLAESYPETRHDAWAAAARVYERRLKNPTLAREAYARVPATSPHFKDAQRRAGKP